MLTKCINILNAFDADISKDDIETLKELSLYLNENIKDVSKNEKISKSKFSKIIEQNDIEKVANYYKDILNGIEKKHDCLNEWQKKYGNVYHLLESKAEIYSFIQASNLEEFKLSELKILYYIIFNKNSRTNKKADLINEINSFIQQRNYYTEFREKF
ncbi:UNVERIFIED_ORG: hypothetical protein B2H93_06055 [Clostridium botulinum]